MTEDAQATDHSRFTHCVTSTAPRLQAFFQEHLIAPTGIHISLFSYSVNTLRSENAPNFHLSDFRNFSNLHVLILF